MIFKYCSEIFSTSYSFFSDKDSRSAASKQVGSKGSSASNIDARKAMVAMESKIICDDL